MMSFALLILVKTIICVTIIIYSNLIVECGFLSKSFTKDLSAYHKENILYILGTMSLILAVLFFNLTIKVPDNITYFQVFKFTFVQALFIFIGCLSLKRSTKKSLFVAIMKHKLAIKKHNEGRQLPVRVYVGKNH